MAEKIFNAAELAKFDGQKGQPAYVAINGVVYDVTKVSAWPGGKHHGNVAGRDLSEAIKKSPHKLTVLPKLPVVGKYQA